MTTYTYSIEAASLLQALQAVEVSMPSRRDECRTYLCGIRVELQPGALDLITTDGHRMGHAWLPATCEVGGEFSPVQFTIEGADVKALLLAMKDAAKSSQARCVWEFTPAPDDSPNLPGELKILSAGRTAIVRTQPVNDGVFPPWRRVMPRKGPDGVVTQGLPHNPDLVSGSFNCDYLAGMAKACGAIMKGDKYGRMTQHMLPGSTYARATNQALEFEHVVMAMRGA